MDHQSMNNRQYKDWTDFEIAKLIKLRNKGVTNKAIAHRLGRTSEAVAQKIASLKLPPAERKNRTEKTHKFTIYLPMSIYSKLDKQAAVEGLPKARLVRSIIEDYVDREQEMRSNLEAIIAGVREGRNSDGA